MLKHNAIAEAVSVSEEAAVRKEKKMSLLNNVLKTSS